MSTLHDAACHFIALHFSQGVDDSDYDDAIAALDVASALDPCADFAAYCERRRDTATDPAARQWWARLAGNARKAATM